MFQLIIKSGKDFSRVCYEDTYFNRELMRGAAPIEELREKVKKGGVMFIFGNDAVWMTILNPDCVIKIDGKVMPHGQVKLLPGEAKRTVGIAHLDFTVEVNLRK